MTTGEVQLNGRPIGGRKGAAGGSNDGSSETQAKGNSGGMVTRNRAGGPEREAGIGAVNLNVALRISQYVNPGRT